MKLFRNAIANVRAALERRGRALALPPSPEALALEAVNPLRGIGVSGAQDIFDAARRGNFATLGRVYAEIEAADPTLLVVSERRGGALSDLAWRMKDADGRAPGFDAGLAREQAQAAEGMLAGAENFGAAVEHLAGAFFRGAALAQPRYLEDGTLLGFVLVPLEAACYDASRDMWQLNPSLSPQEPGAGAPGLVDVPPEDGMVSVSRRRHIDYPALMVYIRGALGERHWGRFVDRFGLPPAVLTMPPMAAAEDEDRFLRAARAAADGRTVALPNGSGVTFASDARGVNPFSEYLRHQQELVVLMATGGLLTTLAESGSGTLAGGAHQETWRQVVRKDARVVAEALQAQLVAPWLRRMFPGRPVCSVFDFDAEPAPTASEVLDDAVKARSAGYEMDADELSEKTGYTLRPAPQPAQTPFPQSGSFANAKPAPLLNSRTPETPRTALSALADAFRSDLGPAAGELRRLLDLPDDRLADGARELMGRLDDLLPADPETVAVLAEEMARAFAEGANDELRVTSDERDAAVENAISHPCPKCHRQMAADGTCTFCANREANHAAGKAAFEKVKASHQDVVGAMERDSIGKIDFIWGTKGTPAKKYEDGEGFDKILTKHKATASAIPGVIAYGDVYEDTVNGKYYIVKKRYVVSLRKRTGANSYVITGFQADDPNYVADIRKRCELVEKGE